MSIVGEGERKLLREIHKKAKDQLASRKVPQSIVDTWRKRIDRMGEDIEAVLKEEKKEKELRTADIELKRVRKT